MKSAVTVCLIGGLALAVGACSKSDSGDGWEKARILFCGNLDRGPRGLRDLDNVADELAQRREALHAMVRDRSTMDRDWNYKVHWPCFTIERAIGRAEAHVRELGTWQLLVTEAAPSRDGWETLRFDYDSFSKIADKADCKRRDIDLALNGNNEAIELLEAAKAKLAEQREAGLAQCKASGWNR